MRILSARNGPKYQENSTLNAPAAATVTASDANQVELVALIGHWFVSEN